MKENNDRAYLQNNPILRRAYLYLDELDWQNAYAYADKALDSNPENCEAYICKLLCELELPTRELLDAASVDFSNSTNFKNAVKFANDEQHKFLQEALTSAQQNQKKRLSILAERAEIAKQREKLVTKINSIRHSIYMDYDFEKENKKLKKLKILSGIYILFLLMFWGSEAFAIFDMLILFGICFGIGAVGTLVIHLIFLHEDYSLSISFCLFFLNFASLGIWGLIKSIKYLIKRRTYRPRILKKRLDKNSADLYKYEKELEEFDKVHNK